VKVGKGNKGQNTMKEKDKSLHKWPQKKSDKTDAMLTAYSNNTPNDNEQRTTLMCGANRREDDQRKSQRKKIP
jgi:hypothetical protein